MQIIYGIMLSAPLYFSFRCCLFAAGSASLHRPRPFISCAPPWPPQSLACPLWTCQSGSSAAHRPIVRCGWQAKSTGKLRCRERGPGPGWTLLAGLRAACWVDWVPVVWTIDDAACSRINHTADDPDCPTTDLPTPQNRTYCPHRFNVHKTRPPRSEPLYYFVAVHLQSDRVRDRGRMTISNHRHPG